jgi:hypothetical protein
LLDDAWLCGLRHGGEGSGKNDEGKNGFFHGAM